MGDQERCRAGRSRAGPGRHQRQLQPGTGLPPWLHRAGAAVSPAALDQAGCRPRRAPRSLQSQRGSGARQPGTYIIYKGLGSMPGEPIKWCRFAY